MINPPKIQQASIRVPTTMNEIQAGFMVSALGWFLGENPQAAVNLVWDTSKNAGRYAPYTIVYTSGDNNGKNPHAAATRAKLQSYVDSSAEIPAVNDVAAHRRAFELVAEMRRTQVSSSLGYA
ncbi:MAG: hypothetical protein PHD48_03020 [Alphaproteobacteria bacterium]|nr:hypothetical protein [Alphaproteobacteria bacterium]